MDESDVIDRLRSGNDTPTVTAFPDGSRDIFYHIRKGDHGRVTARETFGELVSDGHSPSLDLVRRAVEPGGHAVNLAHQSTELGDDVTLFGHLDDPVFDDLRVDAVSLGEPARVAIYEFNDGDLILVEESSDITHWGFEDIRNAAGDDLEVVLTADAVCCTNWAAFDGMTEALAELAALELTGGLFVVDPGYLTTRDHGPVADFMAVLGELENSYDVVMTANEGELNYVADALGLVDADTNPPVGAIRDVTGVTAVVSHGLERADAATPEGRLSVPNFRVSQRRRDTGGGDRFDAGLAHTLAAGWGWKAALEVGNRCAAFYVENGTSGTPRDLASFDRPRYDDPTA